MYSFGGICLLISLFCSFSGLLFLSCDNSKLKRVFSYYIRWSVFIQFCLLSMALLRLMSAYINVDLTFANVAENSHEFVPMAYRIAGVWGNYDGSLLLWVWILSVLNIVFMRRNNFDQIDDRKVKRIFCERIVNKILSTQLFILGLFLAFIIFYANPFLASKAIILFEGKGFNPLLQDVGLAIHPPVLYCGYLIFSIIFSSVIVGLYEKRCDESWFENIYFIALLGWSILTLGIGLGGWWAYRELGWGGFWFWDPVENISLIVWLSSTAAIHMMKISMQKKMYHRWTVVLCALTFLLAVLGVFLTRSGMLVSVHSFALDISKSLFLLVIFLLLMAVFLHALLKGYKSNFTSSSGIERSGSKRIYAGDWQLLTCVLFMIVMCCIVLFSVIYPAAHKIIYDQAISIDENFYQKTLSYIFIPTLLVSAMYSSRNKFGFYINSAIALLLVLAITQYFGAINSLVVLIYLFLGALIFISIIRFYRENIGLAISHIGISILVIGCALYYGYEFEKNFTMASGDSVNVKGYNIALEDILYNKKENFLSREAKIRIKDNTNEHDGRVTNDSSLVNPEIRFYPVENVFTYESARYKTWKGDVYITIGGVDSQDKLFIRVQYKPFIYMIWFSIIMMFGSVFYRKILYIYKK